MESIVIYLLDSIGWNYEMLTVGDFFTNVVKVALGCGAFVAITRFLGTLSGGFTKI